MSNPFLDALYEHEQLAMRLARVTAECAKLEQEQRRAMQALVAEQDEVERALKAHRNTLLSRAVLQSQGPRTDNQDNYYEDYSE